MAPRFFGPFEILAKKGSVACELDLLDHLKVCNVFHTFLLKKYLYDTKHAIDWSLLQVEPKRNFVPKPFHILDKREVQLKKHTIVQLKVKWKHFEADEAALET